MPSPETPEISNRDSKLTPSDGKAHCYSPKSVLQMFRRSRVTVGDRRYPCRQFPEIFCSKSMKGVFLVSTKKKILVFFFCCCCHFTWRVKAMKCGSCCLIRFLMSSLQLSITCWWFFDSNKSPTFDVMSKQFNLAGFSVTKSGFGNEEMPVVLLFLVGGALLPFWTTNWRSSARSAIIWSRSVSLDAIGEMTISRSSVLMMRLLRSFRVDVLISEVGKIRSEPKNSWDLIFWNGWW